MQMYENFINGMTLWKYVCMKKLKYLCKNILNYNSLSYFYNKNMQVAINIAKREKKIINLPTRVGARSHHNLKSSIQFSSKSFFIVRL